MFMNKNEFKISNHDKLAIPEEGDWAEKKYKLVALYDKLFSTGMKRKWDKRIYIDLFCGPGKVKLRGTRKIVYSSPLLALTVPDPFDIYIFCDKDKNNINTLKSYVGNLKIEKEIKYFDDDCNIIVQELINYIKNIKGSVLSFCFLDPYGLGDLQFDTIKKLSSLKIDFLILLPTGYDANLNKEIYLNEKSYKLDTFLGNKEWRKEWELKKSNNFVDFFLREYINQMVRLSYINISPSIFDTIYAPGTKKLYYHLAFFSKHKLGYKFWKEGKKSSSPQKSLDFG